MVNWRENAKNYGGLSGILAGFCIAFITFFLTIFNRAGTSKDFGELTLVFLSIAAFSFIKAAERFFQSIASKDEKKYDYACHFYNIGISLMLAGLLLMFITFDLPFAAVVASIILIIEIYLVVRVYLP
jgi:hypothetical protein